MAQRHIGKHDWYENKGHTGAGNNKDFEIIFWLQFSKVRYIAVNCAKFLKNQDSTPFLRELP